MKRRHWRWVLAGMVSLVILAGGLRLREVRDAASIRVWDENRMVNMALETYVARAVAAEMPAAYQPEALKAQAVAARTRALNGCARHPEADVCTDSGCCQGYLSPEAQRARWGASYPVYRAKVAQAVSDTRGECLLYGGQLIEALYHAVSGGQTEDVEAVFSTALPYLRSVPSAGEDFASRYETETCFSRTDFCARLSNVATLTPACLSRQVRILSVSASGRVLSAQVGDARVDGRTLRARLGLASTCFTLAFTGDTVVISQRGYGHGVGMSQAGAEAMARGGADYRAILQHYYTGVDIARFME